MREIKFRAWDLPCGRGNTEKQKEMIYFDLYDLDDGYINTQKATGYLGKGFILMQYTGLKDKSGKEIYEGDVFNFHPSKEWKDTEPDNPCVVFWSDKLAAWMFYVGRPEMSTLLPPPESIEIIGNIYENPELVKEKK